MFTGKDYLDGLADDSQLLDEVVAPLAGTRFERRSVWTDGRAVAMPTLVELPSSIGFAARIDAPAVEVLTRCDGHRRLCEIAEEASAELGVEPGELRKKALAAVKRLFELGFLAPPSG